MSKGFVFIENGLVKYEDYSRLIDKCEKALKDNRTKGKEIERLHSIINKAISKTKDIEFSITGKDFNYYLKLKDIEQGKELLQILKGSDKE